MKLKKKSFESPPTSKQPKQRRCRKGAKTTKMVDITRKGNTEGGGVTVEIYEID